MAAVDDEDVLQTRVIPAEYEEITRRRKTLLLDSLEVPGDSSPGNLVGLSLSGGGIRSATFSLGVLQKLAQRGVLRRVDYLSTVSGGGYLGGSVSSLLTDDSFGTGDADFPLRDSDGSGEPPALTHLRNSSNYLKPSGLLSGLRLPLLLVRGFLLNLLVMLPVVMLTVLVLEVAYVFGPNWNHVPRLILPLLFLFVVLTILYPLVQGIFGPRLGWRTRNAFELSLAVPILLALLLVAVVPLLRITRWAIEHSWTQVLDWFRGVSATELWLSLAAGVLVVVVFMLVGSASEGAEKFVGKALILLVGLMGPGIVFGGFLLLALTQIQSPFLSVSYCPVLAGQVGRQAIPSEPDLKGELLDLVEDLEGRGLELRGATVHVVNSDPPTWYNERAWYDWSRRPAAVGACASTWTVTPASGEPYTIERVSVASLKVDGVDLGLWEGRSDVVYIIVGLGLWLFTRYFLNVNIASPHGFYRDRLSKAYIFRVGQNGAIESNDGLKLSELNREETAAPYHLINAALNLEGTNNPDLRGRGSAPLLFSKLYIGSDVAGCGYAKTEDLEKYDPNLSLATAVAVSGAAAAPNMGKTTVKPLVFVLSLLNIRLGYWLPNPRFVDRKLKLKRLRLNVPPRLLWNEALGRLTTKGKHINVSDGGHIENLGVYPLLQRQCQQIIVIDGEADPDCRFTGLAALLRYARISLGIKIELDLDQIRKSPENLSSSHWALGVVTYPNGQKGELLYVKLSVTGDEPEDVKAYRAFNPHFPHESTADQFFSEDQFEAYRTLGGHVGDDVLDAKSAIGGFRDLVSSPSGDAPAKVDRQVSGASKAESERQQEKP